jgi:hypothetical protein
MIDVFFLLLSFFLFILLVVVDAAVWIWSYQDFQSDQIALVGQSAVAPWKPRDGRLSGDHSQQAWSRGQSLKLCLRLSITHRSNRSLTLKTDVAWSVVGYSRYRSMPMASVGPRSSYSRLSASVYLVPSSLYNRRHATNRAGNLWLANVDRRSANELISNFACLHSGLATNRRMHVFRIIYSEKYKHGCTYYTTAAAWIQRSIDYVHHRRSIKLGQRGIRWQAQTANKL